MSPCGQHTSKHEAVHKEIYSSSINIAFCMSFSSIPVNYMTLLDLRFDYILHYSSYNNPILSVYTALIMYYVIKSD